MFKWYRDLSSSQRLTFWACFGGWGLDAMDFQIYFFVIPTLISLWKISNAEAGFIATVTLLASAVGGWLAGMFSDRYGRLKVLQVTIIWYAVFTFLCGFANSYWQLLILRTLQGIGFGGEWAIGAVLLGEMVRPQDRAKAVGCVQSSYGIGWGLAAASYGIVFSLVPPELAWRWMFWLGLAPVLLVVYIRAFLKDESEVFKAAQTLQTREGFWAGLVTIFAPSNLKRTVLAACLCLGVQAGTGGLLVWLPTFLKNSRGLSVVGTMNYSLVITLGSFFGFVAGAYLSDAVGRRKNFIFWAITCSCVVVAYTWLPVNDTTMLFLGFPLGFFVCGIYGGIGAYLTELFPTRIRATAQSFTYNFGRAMGAAVPFAIGALSSAVPLGQAISIFAVGSYTLVLIAVLLLPETYGTDLYALDREKAGTARARS